MYTNRVKHQNRPAYEGIFHNDIQNKEFILKK
jgi:hypothetical protein